MKSRLFIFIVVIGLMALAAGWVYESRLRTMPDTAVPEIPDNIDYFLTNLNYRAVDADGNLEYEFSSSRLEHRPLNDISHIQLPSLKIYRDADRWQVNAELGELQHADNLLWLRRQVLMQKSGAIPFELRTESIQFDPARDLVRSDSGVLMQSRQARIEADTAVFDLAGKVYRLGKTRAVYYDDED